jgi:hypothetical protein
VTSNRFVGGGGEVFGDEIVAAAMIVGSSTTTEDIALEGDSYRLKAPTSGAPPPTTPPTSPTTEPPEGIHSNRRHGVHFRSPLTSGPSARLRPSGVPDRSPKSAKFCGSPKEAACSDASLGQMTGRVGPEAGPAAQWWPGCPLRRQVVPPREASNAAKALTIELNREYIESSSRKLAPRHAEENMCKRAPLDTIS